MAQPDLTQQRDRSGSSVTIWLVLIVIVGGALRLYDLGGRGLWLDEMFSLATSTGHYPDMSPLVTDRIMERGPDLTHMGHARPWYRIWTNMREGVHPPLYILALRFWRAGLGDGTAAARGLSAAASIVSIVLIFDVARGLLGPAWGLWAAALMACAGPQVHAGRDARPYALLMMLGLGAMDALVRIEKRGPGLLRLIALGVCMFAMGLTHYFAFGALVAMGIYVIVRFRGKGRVITLGTMGLAGAVFLAAWGPSIWAQRHNTSYTFLIEHSPHPKWMTLARVDAMPLRFLINAPETIYAYGGGMLLLAACVYFVRRRRELLLPLLWLVWTLGFVAALDFFRGTQHLFNIRYPLLASAGLYLLLPGILKSMPRWLGHGVGAALVLLCLSTVPMEFAQPPEMWGDIAQTLEDHAAPQDLVVFPGSEEWIGPARYMCTMHYAPGAKWRVLVLTRPASGKLLGEASAYSRLWVVGDLGSLTYLPGCRPDQVAQFGRMFVVSVHFPGQKDALTH